MKNKDYYSVVKMISYIDRAINYTSKIDFEEFSNNIY